MINVLPETTLAAGINEYFDKNNLYESKNKIDRFFENMDRDLSIYYLVLLHFWSAIIFYAFAVEDILIDYFIGPVDDVCGCPVCRYDRQSISKQE